MPPRSRIFIDIETLPALSMTAEERRALVESKVPGNYKKPEAIEKWIAENADEAWRSTSLDCHRGTLLAIAYAVDDGPVDVLYADGAEPDERLPLAQLAEAIPYEVGAAAEWVGHNILGFDLPWLWRRAVRYGFRGLAEIMPHTRYDKRAVDTAALWGCTDPRSYTKLSVICDYLGIPSKQGLDGSRVYAAWADGEHDRIREYAASDVEATREVWRRITGGAL